MANYFDNDIVQGMVEQYLLFTPDERKINIAALDLRKKIMVEAGKIVNGIIFKHKFTVWDSYDDLYQEALVAIMGALEKFNPNFITSKGIRATVFNYFSLTAKNSLKFFTMRNKKNRDNSDIDDHINILIHEHDIYENKDTLSLEFIVQLKTIFVKLGHKKIMPMIDLLNDYLMNIGLFNKRDFFRYCKLHAYSPNQIRKFLRIIKESKEEFSELMGG